MSLTAGFKEKDPKRSHETADIPPSLSDLHCFTETEGVITTSACPTPAPPSLQPTRLS